MDSFFGERERERQRVDTTIGGSCDDGRGSHHSSAGKGKTQVNPQTKPKEKGELEIAMLRYLQGKDEDAIAMGEEPLFDGRYAPPPVLGQTNPPLDRNNTPKDY